MKIYLAGPDVFFPNAREILQAKKSICAEYGHIGESPLDNEINFDEIDPSKTGLEIAAANFELMRKCDAVIANLTPFRGPSADPGTVGEIFYMAGLGKVIFGYSNTGGLFENRVTADEFMIERFKLWDNLMLPGLFVQTGGGFYHAGTDLPYDDLSLFRKAASLIHAA